MRHIKLFREMLLLALLIFNIGSGISQTLYDDVGHIPSAYQETWTKAGLLTDATSITPKAVFVVTEMPGYDLDDKVAAAIDSARDHVSSTSGLGIVYFPEGTHQLWHKIQLDQDDENIVFQGAGSDKTTLVFNSI